MNIRYQRRQTTEAKVGCVSLGSAHPIRLQSMADVSTMDTEAAVAQAIRIIDAGADFVRFTAQGEREAKNLGVIREKLRSRNYNTPLIADIHFNPKAADAAAVNVEKVRINPGNYVDKAKTFHRIDYTDAEYENEILRIRERFIPFLQRCRAHGTAIRIGVNHGSLSDRIMSRYGDTPQGMVASCMEYLRICKEMDFDDVVISIKASNTVLMVQTVRLLVETMNTENMRYPLHLGVTEAGNAEDGRIKSAVGIGTLLADGIGDTIRVSLSEPPENEVLAAKKLTNYILERTNHALIETPDTYTPHVDYHRTTRSVCGIGGRNHPVVIASYCPDETLPLTADFLYAGKYPFPSSMPVNVHLLVDAEYWDKRPNTFPYFRASEVEKALQCPAELKFIELKYSDIDIPLLDLLRRDNALAMVFDNAHPNSIGEARAMTLQLKTAGCDIPVILRRNYRESDPEGLQLKVGVDFGAALIDGIGEGIFLCNNGLDAHITTDYMFAVLQAARARISKTEYISCPGCGRTLYDLQTTVARVKAATSHLKGLKIGIMGCIVNGPGEMADADYGYVGAGYGRINLYKGKECVRKNIPESEAVEQLINLIKISGDWQNNS